MVGCLAGLFMALECLWLRIVVGYTDSTEVTLLLMQYGAVTLEL